MPKPVPPVVTIKFTSGRSAYSRSLSESGSRSSARISLATMRAPIYGQEFDQRLAGFVFTLAARTGVAGSDYNGVDFSGMEYESLPAASAGGIISAALSANPPVDVVVHDFIAPRPSLPAILVRRGLQFRPVSHLIRVLQPARARRSSSSRRARCIAERRDESPVRHSVTRGPAAY